jgi:hypothetical protein
MSVARCASPTPIQPAIGSGVPGTIAEEWNRHIEVFEEELEEFKRHFD